MKRKLTVWLICTVLLIAFPLIAHADMGPKPSVQIVFTDMPGESFYGTLLSERDSIGPASAWDGVSAYDSDRYGEDDYAIWKKFVEYEDTDGFYFLQEWWHCSENGRLNWTYYPPSPFKILLYFPESDTFCVSPVYERYAFDSHFTVDLSQYKTGRISAEASYAYAGEIGSLIVRIVLTILLELAVALLFGYREKRLLILLTAVNVTTQVMLNVLLYGVYYYSGALTFAFFYVLLELVVAAIEAVLYAFFIPRRSIRPQKKGKAVAYALVANAVSFVVGLCLARAIPSLF